MQGNTIERQRNVCMAKTPMAICISIYWTVRPRLVSWNRISDERVAIDCSGRRTRCDFSCFVDCVGHGLSYPL